MAARHALCCALLCVATLLAWAAPGQAERRLALVIGNANYQTSPLKNPVNDAKDIAAQLKKMGFEVSLLTDAGKKAMVDASRDFGARLKEGGVGLFFFAGHGMQIKGENYLVPVDAKMASEADAEFECLEANRLLRHMEDAKNELNIIILDACRNNPFARSFRSAGKGLAQMDAPAGSLIAFGTSPGAVASDGDGRNGLYTHSLLKHINTPGLPLADVFMRVRMDVMQESGKKQIPWESSSVTGYFYFAGQGQGGAVSADAERLSAEKVRLEREKREMEAMSLNLRREQAQIAEEKQQLASLQSKSKQAAQPLAPSALQPAVPAPSDAQPEAPRGGPEAQLEAKLRDWRKAKAEAEHLPIYLVLTNDQIQEIARKLPANHAALAAISGLEAKATRYGEEIISMVRLFAPQAAGVTAARQVQQARQVRQAKK